MISSFDLRRLSHNFSLRRRLPGIFDSTRSLPRSLPLSLHPRLQAEGSSLQPLTMEVTGKVLSSTHYTPLDRMDRSSRFDLMLGLQMVGIRCELYLPSLDQLKNAGLNVNFIRRFMTLLGWCSERLWIRHSTEIRLLL